MLPSLMTLWRDRHDRIFTKSIKPIQGTFDTGRFTAAWSVLFNHVSANHQFRSDRLWCGECGYCIYHAAGNSHAGNSPYPVSAINPGWYFRSKGGTDDRTGFKGAGLWEADAFFPQDDRKHGSSYADYQGNKRCTTGNPVYYVLIYRDYRSTDDVYRRSCACLVPKREAFGGIACDDTSAAWGFCGIFKADPSLL